MWLHTSQFFPNTIRRFIIMGTFFWSSRPWTVGPLSYRLNWTHFESLNRYILSHVCIQFDFYRNIRILGAVDWIIMKMYLTNFLFIDNDIMGISINSNLLCPYVFIISSWALFALPLDRWIECEVGILRRETVEATGQWANLTVKLSKWERNKREKVWTKVHRY